MQAQGVVGGVQPGADQRVDAAQQFRVVQQQRMQVEEFADFLRQRAVQAFAQVVHLAAHGLHRGVDARQFRFDLGRLDPRFLHVQCMRQADAGPSQRAAAGGGGAGQDLAHQASPSKRRSEQGRRGVGGGFGILAIDAQHDRAAGAGGQQHHAHDALGVDLAASRDASSVAWQRNVDSSCTSLAVARACRPRRLTMVRSRRITTASRGFRLHR